MARIDGKSKVTGKALYADDLFLDRMLHARPVHAEHAHAELVSVDTAPALAVPGVVDVLTATGVPGMNRVGGILKDHYVLAFDKTRYVGDVVAVVAAETPAAARAGARAVRIQARPLEPLLDPEATRLAVGVLAIPEGRGVAGIFTTYRELRPAEHAQLVAKVVETVAGNTYSIDPANLPQQPKIIVLDYK